MEKIKSGMFYVAMDGDSIGSKVGRAVIANDVEELHKVSARIDAAQEFILNWCKQVDGIKISGGGDEATIAVPKKALKEIENLRKGIEKSFDYTISVGVGKSLSEAGTSLLVAKFRGKNRTVYYDKKVVEDIESAKKRVKEGKASQEENKLSQAYLEKAENMLCNLHKKHTCLEKSEEGKHAPHTDAKTDDPCPYCADNEDNRTDDCQYCQDLDAEENADGTAGIHDCPACKDYDSKQSEDGCPYCEEMTNEQANPQQSEDHICNCPNCPEKDQSNLAVQDMSAEGPDNCPECQELYSNAIENEPGQTAQEDPSLQGHETAEEVLDLLDQEPGKGAQTPEEATKKIDNTEMPQGDEMKDNVSVTDDFGQAQKENIPDSDLDSENDGPDLAGVLQSGLDEHSQDIQKQKVMDMVAQTLQGFKTNKQALEQSKEQNQGLYNSCIQMLKSMIELCKLLRLEPKMSPEQSPGMAQSSGGEEQSQPKIENFVSTGTEGKKQESAPGEHPDPKAKG